MTIKNNVSPTEKKQPGYCDGRNDEMSIHLIVGLYSTPGMVSDEPSSCIGSWYSETGYGSINPGWFPTKH